MSAAMVLAEAEAIGDTRMIKLLTCPECGFMTFAGSSRRSDAIYCSDRCRSRATRRRVARRARSAA
ncbi:hypothetical protein ADK52_03550 [Streptomyces sp. WM6372]|uniref:hypothetical protein n=1 Tax=Streptomyces sp. WM6372 TaxID=1415555 RepID=UPI0006AE58C8|nr:hypothetical protein [Streptomyces sp. WM6372]KOU31263.1 hypothetical protein ADK52_03550 [Streptomyces sp. WM6372]